MERTAATPTKGSVLERIGRIADLLRRCAAKNETLGRLAPEVVDGLHAQRLLHLLLPRAYGGDEVDLGVWFAAMEALGRLDGSTAWCVGQMNGCALTASALDPSVARTIWGEPRAALSWGPPLTSRAEKVQGGHLLSGEWTMSSGSRHATWLGLMAPVAEPSAGDAPRGETPAVRIFFVPAHVVEWVENWNVIGLVATNSGGFKVEAQFVPDGYSVAREHVREVKIAAPLYNFALNNLFALGFAGVALGIARAMLDASLGLAREKKPRLARHALLESHLVQFQLGAAEARWRSARGYVEATAERVWREVVEAGRLTIPQRIDIRMATTFAIHEAKSVADAAWEIAGASAIFHSAPFERRMRDISTLTQQVQGRKSHLQDVGAYLMGLEPNLVFA
jgi:alkylation response protein AidB-like acyl-CoA dehydrogenase